MLNRRTTTATALLVAVAITAMVVVGPRPAVAADAYLRGVDVSDWQGKPAWVDVKNAGVRFVIAEASNANTGRDPEYARNRTRLHKLGVAFTAYHHAKPDLRAGDAIAEADNFLAAARLLGSDLLPVLELKSHGDLSPEQLTAWVKAFLVRVEERLGVKSIIYASSAFWVERLSDTTWFADNGHLLWVRHWGVDSPSVPAGNWGGHGWTLWQYGKAAVPGIRSKVDVNWFNGTVLAPLRIKNNR